MNIFKKLFGISDKKNEDSSIDKYLEKINSLRKPALLLSKSNNLSINQIGGLPRLPMEIEWPQWKGKPMSFLCQLDLSAIPKDYTCDLPKLGVLFFFYDSAQSTWGFDPKDKGSWKLIYIQSNLSNHPKREAPLDLKKSAMFKAKNIQYTKIKTYPDAEDERIWELPFSDSQFDNYCDLKEEVFGGYPKHQLFGYPSPIQGNDMDLECQLVANGLYCGDTTGYEHPKRKQLESNKQDWVLLLQLDTDDDCEMMWGDAGTLYFWIRKQDLKSIKFERCWMIFQCS